ncbi:alpha/beta fold hydrolase [Yimella sp. cx-51]|nr:alpha/beta fold hydrolase [Yimella sp. cx-51]
MDSVVVAADDGVSLHVAVCGQGADVLVLSGGPGCVHYLADESFAPTGFRCWFPDPRGVSRSGGGPHDMATAVADLEAIRRVTGVESWIVLGHSGRRGWRRPSPTWPAPARRSDRRDGRRPCARAPDSRPRCRRRPTLPVPGRPAGCTAPSDSGRDSSRPRRARGPGRLRWNGGARHR